MKLKTKVMIAGTTGLVIASGVIIAVRIVKRRVRRVINRKLRRALEEIAKMGNEDFMPGGMLGQSLFRRYIEKLDNRQLITLCALVQVGHHLKMEGVDPLHPSKSQIQKAVEKFHIEERLAPLTRTDLLDALDSIDVREALVCAFNVLADA